MSSRRRGIRILGVALVVYGLVGIVIFVGVALGVARPIHRTGQLSQSVDKQRAALVASLAQAETTMRGLSTSATNVSASLAQATTAIDHAATISHGVATSMYGLRDAMSLSILGTQPLLGLATNFDTTGQNLDQLGNDVANIGTALQTNQTDVVTTAQNLSNLADSINALMVSVRDGPGLAISSGTLNSLRLVIYAITAWLGVLAVGCLIAGIWLLRASRRRSKES
jgi:hypothetical protein